MFTSIVIPNFNGKHLLEKNLPSVLDVGADEVIVCDDSSSDDSVAYLKEKFPRVKLVVNPKNLGFILSVNKLFKEASGEIVVLLNNDVKVSKNLLPPLVNRFKDEKVFAVNCHEEGSGYGEAFWKEGFFQYSPGAEGNDIHRSSWASGGSAAFRKKIWQNLGGLDPIFTPGYWEDIDLSFRAIKSGYYILWEPKALVIHKHESTMSKAFKKKYMNWVKQRNQLLFIWKNIDDRKLLKEHRNFLIKRLLGKMGIGYWVPFLWALWKGVQFKNDLKEEVLSDMEVIDYVRSKD